MRATLNPTHSNVQSDVHLLFFHSLASKFLDKCFTVPSIIQLCSSFRPKAVNQYVYEAPHESPRKYSISGEVFIPRISIGFGGPQRRVGGVRGTASEQSGNTLKSLRTCTWKPRPDSGLDCRTCAIFAGQKAWEDHTQPCDCLRVNRRTL